MKRKTHKTVKINVATTDAPVGGDTSPEGETSLGEDTSLEDETFDTPSSTEEDTTRAVKKWETTTAPIRKKKRKTPHSSAKKNGAATDTPLEDETTVDDESSLDDKIFDTASSTDEDNTVAVKKRETTTASIRKRKKKTHHPPVKKTVATSDAPLEDKTTLGNESSLEDDAVSSTEETKTIAVKKGEPTTALIRKMTKKTSDSPVQKYVATVDASLEVETFLEGDTASSTEQDNIITVNENTTNPPFEERDEETPDSPVEGYYLEVETFLVGDKAFSTEDDKIIVVEGGETTTPPFEERDEETPDPPVKKNVPTADAHSEGETSLEDNFFWEDDTGPSAEEEDITVVRDGKTRSLPTGKMDEGTDPPVVEDVPTTEDAGESRAEENETSVVTGEDKTSRVAQELESNTVPPVTLKNDGTTTGPQEESLAARRAAQKPEAFLSRDLCFEQELSHRKLELHHKFLQQRKAYSQWQRKEQAVQTGEHQDFVNHQGLSKENLQRLSKDRVSKEKVPKKEGSNNLGSPSSMCQTTEEDKTITDQSKPEPERRRGLEKEKETGSSSHSSIGQRWQNDEDEEEKKPKKQSLLDRFLSFFRLKKTN
nr:uncharacterized protein LOC133616781 [Nerophis lumbriciformis]